jgi:hypothetical protein
MKVSLLSLGAVLLLGSSLAPRLTGAAGVLLRYHFVAGQVITYRVTRTARLTEREGSQPASTATESQTFLAHYQFGHLRADGAASLTVRVDHMVARLTQAGKTTHPVTSPSATQFLQEPNGRRYTRDHRYYGAYSAGDLGSLSPVTVAVGSTWDSTLTDGGPIYKPGTAVTCHNTLVGFVQTPERAANIQTVCSIRVNGASTVNGKRYRFLGSDSLAGRWQFAVRSGRFLAQRLHETITEVGTVHNATGVRRFSARVTQTTVQQLVSVTPHP